MRTGWMSNVVAAALACAAGAGAAKAQTYGVMVADPVGKIVQDQKMGTIGVAWAGDASCQAARLSLDLPDAFRVFFDLGLADTGASDAFAALQAGAIYKLATDWTIDPALRLGVYTSLGAEENVAGANLMLLVGHEMADMSGLSVYGGVGIDANSEEVNPSLAVGAMLNLMESVAVYGEFAYAGEGFLGMGVRFSF